MIVAVCSVSDMKFGDKLERAGKRGGVAIVSASGRRPRVHDVIVV